MKFSVILSNVGACSDRYMTGGYSEGFTTPQLLERSDSLTGLDGIEFVGGNITAENAPDIAAHMKKSGLSAVSIIPDHFGRPEWGKGAFTNPDAEIRAKAVEETMQMVGAARAIDCKTISFWNGQDGFDYPFQADYVNAWKWLVEGVQTCADKAPDMKFSVEYKMREPRNFSFVSNVYSSLLLCEDADRANVGVTIDTGHATAAHENIAMAAAAAMARNKLFHLHINDNYGHWDDDMITGSIHTIEYLEFFWWIKKMGYDGFVSIDQYPYREDSLRAAQESLDWLHTFDRLTDEMDDAQVQALLNANDAVGATRMLRELMFPTK